MFICRRKCVSVAPSAYKLCSDRDSSKGSCRVWRAMELASLQQQIVMCYHLPNTAVKVRTLPALADPWPQQLPLACLLSVLLALQFLFTVHREPDSAWKYAVAGERSASHQYHSPRGNAPPCKRGQVLLMPLKLCMHNALNGLLKRRLSAAIWCSLHAICILLNRRPHHPLIVASGPPGGWDQFCQSSSFVL